MSPKTSTSSGSTPRLCGDHGQPGGLVHPGRADLHEAQAGLGDRGQGGRHDPAGDGEQLVGVVVGRCARTPCTPARPGPPARSYGSTTPGTARRRPDRPTAGRSRLVQRLDQHGQRADLGLRSASSAGQAAPSIRSSRSTTGPAGSRWSITYPPWPAPRSRPRGGRCWHSSISRGPRPVTPTTGMPAARTRCRTSMGVRRHGVVAAHQRAVQVGGDQLRQPGSRSCRPPAGSATPAGAGSDHYVRARPRDHDLIGAPSASARI